MLHSQLLADSQTMSGGNPSRLLWIVFATIIIIGTIELIFFATRKCRPRRLNFFQKILEVIIQIGLLFFSLFVFILTLTFIFAIFGWMAQAAYLKKWKGFQVEEGSTYHVAPSYKVEEDPWGNINIKYDEGKRYETSDSEKVIIALGFFAVPLRCISLLLSILALIVPSLSIKVKNDTPSLSNLLLDIYY